MMYSDYGIKTSIFRSLFPLYAGAGAIFVIFGLILLAFWIWMLVHAIKHDIDYKPVWILVLWFLNIFGAIIYYFAVKEIALAVKKNMKMCVYVKAECVHVAQ